MWRLIKNLIPFPLILIIIFYAIYTYNYNDWAVEKTYCASYNYKEQKRPIKIAILDSGIKQLDIFNGTSFTTYNALENSNDVNPVYNHGTQILSIINGATSNFTHMGVHVDLDVLDIQILDHNGIGNIESFTRGLEYALEQSPDIIHMSFSTTENDTKIEKLIKKAGENNILLVAASGNSLGFESGYPARYKEVISISAIDENMNRYGYSSINYIDYVAPGVNVPVINSLGELENVSGTSYSAAHFTNLLAILKTKLTTKELLDYLDHNTERLGNHKYFGNGIVRYGC